MNIEQEANGKKLEATMEAARVDAKTAYKEWIKDEKNDFLLNQWVKKWLTYNQAHKAYFLWEAQNT
jgi:hypothetical protein